MVTVVVVVVGWILVAVFSGGINPIVSIFVDADPICVWQIGEAVTATVTGSFLTENVAGFGLVIGVGVGVIWAARLARESSVMVIVPEMGISIDKLFTRYRF